MLIKLVHIEGIWWKKADESSSEVSIDQFVDCRANIIEYWEQNFEDPFPESLEEEPDKLTYQLQKLEKACVGGRRLFKGKLPEIEATAGHPAHIWYDELVKTLTEVCLEMGVPSKVSRKPYENNKPSGIILRLARRVEPFLVKDMRSGSIEATAKRIQHAQTRMRESL